MKRILLVHNYYGSGAPSGENQVFEAEGALLRDQGHDVATFVRHSDEIRRQGAVGVVRGALAVPWNPWMALELKRAVDRFRPDVVHVHNTFPLISPSIFTALGASCATVITLHNYRLFCAAGVPMRKGRPCVECLDDRSAWPGFKHGCYRGSRLATLPLALGVSMHRRLGTWDRDVDAFITLTEFQRGRMVAAGLPPEKLYVKPNFYPGCPDVIPWGDRRNYVVFAGRLSEEKGVRTLLQAWRDWGCGAPELRLIGDGNLRPELERMAAGLPVRFLGQVPSRFAQREIAAARLLVLPSECFEGFPMVVREAFAFGTPVAASDLGPLPSIVNHGKSGVIFPPADPGGLLASVRGVWELPKMLERLGEGGRDEFDSKYNENKNYRMLMDIYEAARSVKSRVIT